MGNIFRDLLRAQPKIYGNLEIKKSECLTKVKFKNEYYKLVYKIPLLARRTRPSAARDDRVYCIQTTN